MPTLLLLGGTSAIGKACAAVFAARGWNILLAGRNVPHMRTIADGLCRTDSICCHVCSFDALDTASHQIFWDTLPLMPDVVLCAVGQYGTPGFCNYTELNEKILRTNFNGPVHILTIAANEFAKRRQGTLIGISSVAGLRIRADNIAYGASKAAFTAWLSGMRAALTPVGVHVITVLPGLIDSPMTAGRNLPRCLVASPEKAAYDIFNAFIRKKTTVYTPGFWRPLMAFSRLLPSSLFNRCTR